MVGCTRIAVWSRHLPDARRAGETTGDGKGVARPPFARSPGRTP
jgi:hypothetical protein